MTECGRLIKKYRTKKRLTQWQVSRKLRYETGQAISGIERGIQSIPSDKIDALAFCLGIPKRQLLEAIKRDRLKNFEGQFEI